MRNCLLILGVLIGFYANANECNSLKKQWGLIPKLKI
jgi:hypothetical protein